MTRLYRESRLGFVPRSATSSNMDVIPGAGGTRLATRNPKLASSMGSGPPTADHQLKLAPSKNSTASTKYVWGARTPTIPEHVKLRLVRDPFEPDLGPAW